MKPVNLDDINIVDHTKSKKAITAAALGNGIEWFDFGVYSYVAFALGKVFFPNADPSLQIITALATFSIPFIFRPLGGIFFGRLGDKYGRQKVLAATIILMTLSTACIGLIPSYASIGIWAPILLLIVKIAQGFSVGGEYVGAATFVAEYSPDRKRGFMGSWLDFGSIAGFVVGAGVVSFLHSFVGETAFLDWGWRLPFFLALPLGMIGLYLRNALEETPAYKQYKNSDATKKVSFKEIFSKYRYNLLVCIGIVVCTDIAYYMLLTYLPSYFTHNLHYSEDHGVRIIIAVMVGLLITQPIVGALSDRWGRKPFILTGSTLLIILSYPAYQFLNTGNDFYITLGLIMLSLPMTMLIGIMASILPALFPTAVRYSALAITFNIAILIAGVTPTLTATLVESTQNLMIPAYYLMVCGVFGVITGLYFKETANKPLIDATPIATSKAEAVELLEEFHDSIEQRVDEIDQEMHDLKKERRKLVNQHPELS